MSAGQRLVYVTSAGKTYHLIPHTARYMVTWTQQFASAGLGYRPCQQCFRGTRPRHRGHLIESEGTIQFVYGSAADDARRRAAAAMDEAMEGMA